MPRPIWDWARASGTKGLGGRLARGVACDPPLAGFAVLTAQAFEHDADLLLSREVSSGGSADL